ncbi:hypothetical protein T439DRAFT_325234 [Meredithblackwellia eburnea MCA 4105]
MSEVLSTIEETAASLFQTLAKLAQVQPFPPTPPPTVAQQLVALRREVAHLQASLDQAHLVQSARRQTKPSISLAGVNEEEKERMTRELEAKVDGLKQQVSWASRSGAIKDRAVEALNLAFMLKEEIESVGKVDSETRESSVTKLKEDLKKRDDLALQVLALRTKNEKVASERVKLRKQSMALIRSNVALTNELRQMQSRDDSIVESMNPNQRRQYQKAKHETTALTSRHAIIRNVFQLVVAESGVPWYAPLDGTEDAGGEGMSTAKLRRLMFETGDVRERNWVDLEGEVDMVKEQEPSEQEEDQQERPTSTNGKRKRRK